MPADCSGAVPDPCAADSTHCVRVCTWSSADLPRAGSVIAHLAPLSGGSAPTAFYWANLAQPPDLPPVESTDI